jgi:hypothetical protein
MRDGGIPERTSCCGQPDDRDTMGGVQVVSHGFGAWAAVLLVNADRVRGR